MEILLKTDASLEIRTQSTAENIIFEKVHGLNQDGSVLSFVKTGSSTYIAIPDKVMHMVDAQHQFSQPVIPVNQVFEVLRLLKSNQALAAVKYLKEMTGLGLKEAKDVTFGWKDLMGL